VKTCSIPESKANSNLDYATLRLLCVCDVFEKLIGSNLLLVKRMKEWFCAVPFLWEKIGIRSISSSCFENRVYRNRGVTRLDGARGKKQVWRTHVRTWGLSEANLLLKKVLQTLLGLFGDPPAVIRRPHNYSAPGESRPLFPLVAPLCRNKNVLCAVNWVH